MAVEKDIIDTYRKCPNCNNFDIKYTAAFTITVELTPDGMLQRQVPTAKGKSKFKKLSSFDKIEIFDKAIDYECDRALCFCPNCGWHSGVIQRRDEDQEIIEIKVNDDTLEPEDMNDYFVHE